MIFMDVSQDKALAELEADQSPIHLQELSISARVKLHTGTPETSAVQILSKYKNSLCTQQAFLALLWVGSQSFGCNCASDTGHDALCLSPEAP